MAGLIFLTPWTKTAHSFQTEQRVRDLMPCLVSPNEQLLTQKSPPPHLLPPTCAGQERWRAKTKVPVLVFVPVRDRWPISAWRRERDEMWGNMGGRKKEEGRRTSSTCNMHANPFMHHNTHPPTHTHTAEWTWLALRMESRSESEKSSYLWCEKGGGYIRLIFD